MKQHVLKCKNLFIHFPTTIHYRNEDHVSGRLIENIDSTDHTDETMHVKHNTDE